MTIMPCGTSAIDPDQQRIRWICLRAYYNYSPRAFRSTPAQIWNPHQRCRVRFKTCTNSEGTYSYIYIWQISVGWWQDATGGVFLFQYWMFSGLVCYKLSVLSILFLEAIVNATTDESLRLFKHILLMIFMSFTLY